MTTDASGDVVPLVRDASAVKDTAPQLKVPSALLKSAARAAKGMAGEKGDKKDMAAMHAAMVYRQEHGSAQKAVQGATKAKTQPAVYGLGMSKVAKLGERGIAAAMDAQIDARADGILPSHVVDRKLVKSEGQIAKEEMGSNDKEADSLLPEHNLEAPHKSILQISKAEMHSNVKHANAAMPTVNGHSKRATQGLHLKASQEKQAAQSEEQAIAHKANSLVPEHVGSKKALTREQISAAEERENAMRAAAITPEHTTDKKRLSLAQQEAQEEKQMSDSASVTSVTDSTLDKAISAGKAKETARSRAYRADVSYEARAAQRGWGGKGIAGTHTPFATRKSAKKDPSYSYNKLYEQALAKVKKEDAADDAAGNMDRSMSREQAHMRSQLNVIEGNLHPKLTAAQARSTEAEALNSKHLAAEVSAITTPRGPRDASHLLGQSDASRSMAAIKAANKHLDSEVADITSGIDPAKPRLAAQEKPKHKVVKTHDTKSNTAKMLAGEAKLEQARKDHLFNVYTHTTEKSSPQALAAAKSWAAQSVADNMSKAAKRMHQGAAA